MELKLTTKRVLEYEKRTGKDVLKFLREVEKTNEIAIGDVVELFIACGENYTVEMFDQWEGSFMEKTKAIMNAVGAYLGSSKAPDSKTKK